MKNLRFSSNSDFKIKKYSTIYANDKITTQLHEKYTAKQNVLLFNIWYTHANLFGNRKFNLNK